MFWKALVVTLFVAGVCGEEFKLSPVKKEQLREALKKQCDKVQAPADAVDGVTDAIETFISCITGLVNVDQLKKEIEDAKPNGALDEVFKKYCAKTPQIKTCLHNMLDATAPCLDETYKSHLNSAKNGTDQLLDFVCYKDGDRIALFIAERGPECFTSKSEPIRECAKTIQGSVTTPEDAENLTMAQRCAKFDELSACVVTALEGCDTPTPGNMAESLFKYVRKSSPCVTALPKS